MSFILIFLLQFQDRDFQSSRVEHLQLLELQRIHLTWIEDRDRDILLRDLEAFYQRQDLTPRAMEEANYLAGIFKGHLDENDYNPEMLRRSEIRIMWFDAHNGPFILIASERDPQGVPRSVSNNYLGFILVDIGEGYVTLRREDERIQLRSALPREPGPSWNKWVPFNRIYRFPTNYKDRFEATRIELIVNKVSLDRFLRFATARFALRVDRDELEQRFADVILDGHYPATTCLAVIEEHLKGTFRLRYDLKDIKLRFIPNEGDLRQ